MKILIAPDKFKGSLTASAAAAAMERGFASVWGEGAEFIHCPIADGGEGTARALCDAMGGEWVQKEVHGPLGAPVQAGYAWMPEHEGEGLAVIEMSEASGLALVPRDERQALDATTYGTGELMRDAVERGARRIIVGLGGSATTDGGIGMAEALGFEFLDEAGTPIKGVAPRLLPQVHAVRRGGFGTEAALPEVIAACDVQNPLLGPRGCAHLFSRQKGASEAEVLVLEAAMERLAQLVARDLGGASHEVLGAGAAGGLGFGLLAFAGAQIRGGFDVVAEILELEALIAMADLVFTGEGSLDEQTLEGKGPAGVAQMARRFGKPVIGFGGRVVRDPRVRAVFDLVMPLADAPMPLEEALNEAEWLLESAAARVAMALKIGQALQ